MDITVCVYLYYVCAHDMFSGGAAGMAVSLSCRGYSIGHALLTFLYAFLIGRVDYASSTELRTVCELTLSVSSVETEGGMDVER